MTVVWAIMAAVRASRYLQIGLAMLIGLGGWHAYLAHRDAKVAEKVTAAVAEKSTAIVKRASDARKPAMRPGAGERLRMRYGEGF